MSSNIELGIKLKYDGRDVEGGLSISRENLRQFTIDAQRAGKSVTGSFTSAAEGVRSISTQLDAARNILLSYFSASPMIDGARWIVEQSSAMTQLNARLKVATGSLDDYQRAQAGVIAVSNRWGAALGETASAFARLNPVISQMGGGAGTTLKMLDGLSASLRLSGATSQETSAILLQFSQAMGSGRVGGDEFRSMMEAAEPLMRAVAQQLGKTTSELRQMSEEGKLTSSVFGNALLPAIDKLAAKAQQIPMGVNQAWQVLKNNLSVSFGKEFEGTNALAGVIKNIADHTDEAAAAVHALAFATGELVKIGTVLAAGGVAAYLTKKAQAAYGAAAADLAARAATLASAQADVAAAEAGTLTLKNRLALIEADAQLAAVQRTMAVSQLEAARAMGVQSAAMAAAAQAQIELKAAVRLGMETERSALATKEALTVASAGLASAQAREAEAAAAASLARRAGAGAASLATTAMTALGGPIGVVTSLLMAGAMAWSFWGSKAKSSIDEATERLQRLRNEEKYGIGELGKVKKELADKEALLRISLETRYSSGSAEKVEAIRREIDVLQETIDRLEKPTQTPATTRLSAAGEYGKLTEGLKWREKIQKDHNEAMLKLQASYADKYAEASEKDRPAIQRNHLAALKAAQEQFKQELESLPDAKEGKANAEARSEADIAAWKAQAKRVSEVLKQEWENYRLSTADYVAGTALTEQAAIGHEIDAVKRKISAATKESERIPLRERLAELQATLESLPGKARESLEDADNKAQSGLEKLRSAAGKTFEPLAQAGIKFSNEFGEIMQRAAADGSAATIDAGRAAWDAMVNQTKFDEAKDQFDALFADLKAQLEAIRQGSGNDGGFAAALDAEGAATEIKSKLTPEMEKLLQIMRDAAATNPISRKMVSEATGNLRKIANEIDPVWKDTVKRIDGTFHDGFVKMIEGGKGSWSSFTKSLTTTFKSTVADAIYQFLARPFVFSLLGSVAGVVSSGASAMGLSSIASAANGLGTAANAISGGSSIYQAYQGFTTGGGTGIAGSIGNYLGGLAGSYGTAGASSSIGALNYVNALDSGATLAAAGGTASAEGAAGAAAGLGPWGWVAAAAIAAYFAFGNSGGGPKTEGDATVKIVDGAPVYQGSDGFFTGGSADAQMRAVTETTTASVLATIKSLGGTGNGLSLVMGYNTDPKGKAPDNVTGAVLNADGSTAYLDTHNTDRGNAAADLALEAKRVLLAAIGASDVGAAYKSVVKNIDLMTASAAQLDQAIVDLNNLHSALDFGTTDPFAAYADSLDALGNDYMAQLDKQRAAVTAAASAYNGSTASISALAAATTQRYQIELQLARQIADSLKTTSAAYAQSRETVQLAGLDAAGKYDYYDQQAAKYRDVLSTLTDPTAIADYSGKLNSAIMAGWGTMDATQQAENKARYLALLDQADQLSADRYKAAQDAVKADNTQLRADIASAIDTAMTAAADKIAQANATPTPVDVTVHVVGSSGASAAVQTGGWGDA